MCIFADRAQAAATTLYMGLARHPETGKAVHVMGYQNTVENQAPGPNAMILHLQAKAPITEANFIDSEACPKVLQDMVDTLENRGSRSFSFSIGGDDETPGVRVFEHGIYTVVAADNAALIPAALARVPANRRPALQDELYAFFAKEVGWPVILCCFDTKDAARATPILVWYEPIDADRLIAPAIDCHTGGAPDMNADVEVDHWVIAGYQGEGRQNGETVDYSDAIPAHVQPFLPQWIIGYKAEGVMPNGDFTITRKNLEQGYAGRIERWLPGTCGTAA